MDDLITPRQKTKLKQGCCCGVVLLIIILGFMSFKSLEQGQIGLKFDYMTQNIVGDPITETGLKMVGPLNDLIVYPSVLQLLYFDNYDAYSPGKNEILRPPVVSRTTDGLVVNVKVSFSWRLDKQHVKGLYELLGSAEELLDGENDEERPEDKPSFVEGIVRFARGSLTTVCSEYTAAQFFANQTMVQNRMLEELTDTFNQPEKGLVININKVQLRSVDLPDLYENAIQQTQQEEQDFLTASAERSVRKTQMSTAEMQATQRVLELKIDAEANAQEVLARNEAWVEQYLVYQFKQADAYGRILREMKDAADPFGVLFELMRQKAMKTHDTDKLTMSG